MDKIAAVLIVDDNPGVLYVKSRVLGGKGYRVLEAVTGEEALTVAAAAQPDVVVLDVHLPDIDGFEVCRRLKRDAATRHIKILHTSAVSIAASDRIKGLECGTDAYLIEPVEEEELVSTVGALVRLAEQERENRRLIRKLTRTERQLREATEAADCGIWDWDILTGQVDWFGAHERLAGMKPGSFGGKVEDFTDVLHPDDRGRVWRKVEDRMARRETHYEDEYRFIHPDGTVRWMSATGRFFYNEDGEAVRMTGVVQDVTERIQTEEKLRISEQRLQRVLETDAVGVLFFDRTGTVIHANEVFLRMTGYRREQVDRRELTWRKMTPPEWIGVSEAQMEQFAQTGRLGPYEKEYLRADGSRQWMLFAGRDLGDGTISEYCIDITDRKQAETALRESENRFRVLADQSPEPIWVTNLDGIEFVNAAYCSFFGVTPDDVLGPKWQMLVHPDDAANYIGAYTKALRDRAPFRAQVRVKRADGSWRWIDSRGTPRFSAAGEFLGYVGSSPDITEMKVAQEALRDAQNRLQRWNVELEQAVNVKTAELLHSQERLRALATELNLAEQRERKRVAADLHDHLQQMLVLAKMKLGQGKRLAFPLPACVDLMKQADDVLAEALQYTRTLVAELSPPVLHDQGLAAGLKWLGESMKKHDLTVTVLIPDDDGRGLKLPDDQAVLLFQSVRELLINSWKYAGTGQATVSMDYDEKYLRIEVRDEGAGFDLAAAAAAAAAALPSGGLSSKFGLFSIQERMRAMGGSFDIQSAPGRGTTATLVLPLGGKTSSMFEVQGSKLIAG